MFFVIFIVLTSKNKLGLKEKKIDSKNMFVVNIIIFFLGIYAGFFGAGYGTFVMFLLVSLGYTFTKSAALSRVIGFITSFVATIVFAYSGLINYAYGLSLGAGFAIGAWIGVGVGLKKGDKYIKALFIGIIILTTTKLILGFFGVIIF